VRTIPGEAGDIRIWGGGSPRPLLELVVADFLIAAPTNFVRAAGIGAAGKEKKESFCARDSHLVVRLAMSRFGGGALRGLLSNLSLPDF
jgi:2-methylaconitate cis-trans-isomerase PrpF